MAFRSDRGGHIAGEDISAYVDEDLSSPETARVYAHLQTCDDCRALADDMRATQTLVRELPLVRAPREFTLGPEFDVAPSRAPTYDAPRRGWFNFMPAVAMSAALLLLLVFVDLSTLNLGAEDSSSAGVSSSSRGAEDAAKAASEAAPQQGQAQPSAPRQSPPVPSTGGSSNQGLGPTPAANSAGGAPAGALTGTPVPLLAAPQVTPAATGAVAPPPAAADSTAGRVPTPTSYAVIVDADEAVEAEEDAGISVVRVLEVFAAALLIASLGGLAWQRRRGA